jgi:hypothetical protein
MECCLPAVTEAGFATSATLALARRAFKVLSANRTSMPKFMVI